MAGSNKVCGAAGSNARSLRLRHDTVEPLHVAGIGPAPPVDNEVSSITITNFQTLVRPLGATHFGTRYGGGWLSVTGLVEGLYILHHGKVTAVGGRFLCARHLENVVFDWGGLP